ncbi:nucleotidyltransferase family protein [Photobacterium sp. 1_MG-2023]|nr:nucleotidyltransferase family protein [Photobacterium sp. 1_MG-2023]
MLSDAESQREDQLRQWLRQDQERMQILAIVAALNLPQCYIGAGFVRNLVWDRLLGDSVTTPLNDVDVIYFDPTEETQETAWQIEAWLNQHHPHCVWQVRNQALMHTRHDDPPYQSTLDAIGYWVEQETAVAVRLENDTLAIISGFGLASLFAGHLTHNPRRPRAVFEARIAEKQWLTRWPMLQVISLRSETDLSFQ